MTVPRPEPVLDVRGLHSWFEAPGGLVRAVNGVTLRVNDGERLGVVGESGSGKTQTFFAVLGLAHGFPGVVEGSARVAGVDVLAGLSSHVKVSGTSDLASPRVEKDVERWDRLQRQRLQGVLGHEVAILFQDPKRSLIPYWTIGRHLEEALARRGSEGGGRGAAASLLARLGFDTPGRILQSYPEQLSGGQAQRAFLALSMAMAPRLLVADEPTTGLDIINQQRVLLQLRRVQEEARLALVLISHDLSVVMRVVDRVLVMFGGRVLERAPTTVLGSGVAGPRHPYTRALHESQRRRKMGLQLAPAASHATTAGRVSHGCPYALRCSLRPMLGPADQSRCTSEFPPEVEVDAEHSVACWGVTT